MNTKPWFLVLAASVIVVGTLVGPLGVGPGNLYARSSDDLQNRVPEPSGGSLVGSRQFLGRELLGPRPLSRAPFEIEAVLPGDVTVNSGFEGFGFDDNATENEGVRSIPPDPIGAAGKAVAANEISSPWTPVVIQGRRAYRKGHAQCHRASAARLAEDQDVAAG